MTALTAFVDHLACLCLAWWLARGAASHLVKWSAFRQLVLNYRLLPGSLAAPTAAAVIGAEIIAATLIAAPTAARAFGLLVGSVLLMLLAGAVAVNLVRGRRSLSCGCDLFAPDRPIGWDLAVRNTALAVLAAAAATLPRAAASAPDYLLACSIVLAAAAGQVAYRHMRINRRTMEPVR